MHAGPNPKPTTLIIATLRANNATRTQLRLEKRGTPNAIRFANTTLGSRIVIAPNLPRAPLGQVQIKPVVRSTAQPRHRTVVSRVVSQHVRRRPSSLAPRSSLVWTCQSLLAWPGR